MEPKCVQFLENKTMLITGASGFLAKVFLERILRLQPNVKRLYLLVRASDKKSAEKRLHSEVFEKDLFRVLRKNVGNETLNALISEKVVPVPGDVSLNNMGVSDSNLLQAMMQEVDIVLHSAATTRFDDRYDVALGINTFGALNVLNFAKKCVKSELLLHVSTAYVCGERSGLILENSFAMGETLNGKAKVDINAEMQLVEQKLKQLREQRCSEEEINEAMRDLGLKRAKLYGWPNTYAFSKAMGEMLIGQYRESMPIVIIRPTIITSTISDPFPGWIEGLKTVDSVITSYGKGMLKCFLVDRNAICDIIPVDIVANAMIATAAEHFRDSGSHTVYHVGSSYRNPIMYKQIYEIFTRYFKESPLLGRNGVPIVPTVTVLSTMARFRLYMSLRFKSPLQLLRLLSIIFPSHFGDKYVHHNRKFKRAMKLVKLYEPYLFFKGIFDDRNLETLRFKNEAKETDKMFGYNPKCIDWEDYLMSTHIPGVIKHVLKM
ncbi:LOW QUALITY PROTEIN: putative fatty acyl-CoA reductase 7 [Eutrema salsugineum]|uniref:LOW QUALITY PROTEIN: putative fatty acyl-CoA reductase 7 n=1 Tax=Eutrema salsugineum TaxID=72664 RepID=UPI000CED69A7|nr:LOW QUALITY PROTEIN: putative fatty acyl-CoA reductase 7 [Eutrema salsugineum]